MKKILKNRFQLVKTIKYYLGTGSCSEVYLGKDLQTNCSVAIKIVQKYINIFSETQAIAISTEIKALKICEGPHTNKLIDDFEIVQNYYLFFELW
jgi:serine/threonine protein kinase